MIKNYQKYNENVLSENFNIGDRVVDVITNKHGEISYPIEVPKAAILLSKNISKEIYVKFDNGEEKWMSRKKLTKENPEDKEKYLKIKNDILFANNENDPYGEEEYEIELESKKIKSPKYKIGDVVYYYSPFKITSEFHGKNIVIDILEDVDGDYWYYWYKLEKEKNKDICWISEDDLYENEDGKRKAEEKLKKELLEIEKEKERKEIERKKKIEMMKDTDPYGEEDWTGESLKENFNIHPGDRIIVIKKKSKLYNQTGTVIDSEYDSRWTPFGSVLVRMDYTGVESYFTFIDIEKLDPLIRISKEDPYGEEDWTGESCENDENPYSEENWEEVILERKISYKKHLCPDLWEDFKLKERIRKKLYRIALDFYNEMEIEVELLDIHLTGSISNYNYNSNSDIDLHLVIDYSKVNEDIELVGRAFDGIRHMWNIKHNIVIKGHDVELYVQDSKGEHTSSGVYSIMKDEWIIKPEYNRPIMDQKDVDEKYDVRVSDIERFYKISKQNITPEEAEEYYKAAKQLKKKIMKGRKEGLHIVGEFSLENLVFKKLRKTGKFKKLMDTVTRLYDKIYSQ